MIFKTVRSQTLDAVCDRTCFVRRLGLLKNFRFLTAPFLGDRKMFGMNEPNPLQYNGFGFARRRTKVRRG